MADGKKGEEELDRRAFFRMGIRKAAKDVIDVAEARVNQRATRYIRPPFALQELDFLIKCTRCHDCIDACPHGTIFALSARLGIEVASTPALDLVNGACYLCDGWPCAAACEPGALRLPDTEDEGETQAPPPLPRLAKVKIDPAHCLPYSGPECGVCGSVCPVPGAIEWDMTRPQINSDLCTGCALCRKHCVTDPKAIAIRSL
jgi:ferredoxin-type protein NapG